MWHRIHVYTPDAEGVVKPGPPRERLGVQRGEGQGQALTSQALVYLPSSLPTSTTWRLWVKGRWARASTLHGQDPSAHSTTVTNCLGTQAVAATAPKRGDRHDGGAQQSISLPR